MSYVARQTVTNGLVTLFIINNLQEIEKRNQQQFVYFY